MCEAGRVVHHLANSVEDSRNTVLVVGFMAANTLGRRIREGQKDLRIMGMPLRMKAEVQELSTFSAHADYREIGEYITSLDTSRLKKVFLVHGEDAAQEHLRKHLMGLGISGVEIVRPDTLYELET
jgi:metallo-beta-lactamase family protein